MKAETRRKEIRADIVAYMGLQYGSVIKLNPDHGCLEGTGSLVFDHKNRIAYVCLSERAEKKQLDIFIKRLNATVDKPYKVHSFNAKDENGTKMYHTNVMMAILEKHVIFCTAFVDKKQKAALVKSFKDGGRELLDITPDEVNEMCANTIMLQGTNGKFVAVMSERARKGFSKDKMAKLEKHYTIVASPIPTIENIGGGSARCLCAEIY